MYRNLLVATDGSKLSDKALAHAIALAQSVGATLTAFYAAPEYPMPAYADGVVYEPVSRKEYAKLAGEDAREDPRRRRDEGRGRRAWLQDGLCDRFGSLGSDHRRGQKEQVRRDRDGIARTARAFRRASRQRDAKGADAHQAAGDRRPLAAWPGAKPRAGRDALAGLRCAFCSWIQAHARIAIPAPDPERGSRRGRARQPSADAALGHDQAARRGHLHVDAARPARAAQGRGHRARGDESRRRDRAPDARRCSPRKCGRRRDAGTNTGPSSCASRTGTSATSSSSRPPRKSSPTSRGRSFAATSSCRSTCTTSRPSFATRCAPASASCARANS